MKELNDAIFEAMSAAFRPIMMTRLLLLFGALSASRWSWNWI